MNLRMLALLLGLGLAYAWQHQGELRLMWQRNQPGYQPPAVTLLATKWCGYCQKMRSFFAEKSIPYEEYDVEETAAGRDLMRRVQGPGVPVVLVGEKVIYGYNPDGVMAAIAAR